MPVKQTPETPGGRRRGGVIPASMPRHVKPRSGVALALVPWFGLAGLWLASLRAVTAWRVDDWRHLWSLSWFIALSALALVLPWLWHVYQERREQVLVSGHLAEARVVEIHQASSPVGSVVLAYRDFAGQERHFQQRCSQAAAASLRRGDRVPLLLPPAPSRWWRPWASLSPQQSPFFPEQPVQEARPWLPPRAWGEALAPGAVLEAPLWSLPLPRRGYGEPAALQVGALQMSESGLAWFSQGEEVCAALRWEELSHVKVSAHLLAYGLVELGLRLFRRGEQEEALALRCWLPQGRVSQSVEQKQICGLYLEEAALVPLWEQLGFLVQAAGLTLDPVLSLPTVGALGQPMRPSPRATPWGERATAPPPAPGGVSHERPPAPPLGAYPMEVPAPPVRRWRGLSWWMVMVFPILVGLVQRLDVRLMLLLVSGPGLLFLYRELREVRGRALLLGWAQGRWWGKGQELHCTYRAPDGRWFQHSVASSLGSVQVGGWRDISINPWDRRQARLALPQGPQEWIPKLKGSLDRRWWLRRSPPVSLPGEVRLWGHWGRPARGLGRLQVEEGHLRWLARGREVAELPLRGAGQVSLSVMWRQGGRVAVCLRLFVDPRLPSLVCAAVLLAAQVPEDLEERAEAAPWVTPEALVALWRYVAPRVAVRRGALLLEAEPGELEAGTPRGEGAAAPQAVEVAVGGKL